MHVSLTAEVIRANPGTRQNGKPSLDVILLQDGSEVVKGYVGTDPATQSLVLSPQSFRSGEFVTVTGEVFLGQSGRQLFFRIDECRVLESSK